MSKLLLGKTVLSKQEQNVYAKTVSLRVRQKLEGKDPSLYKDAANGSKTVSEDGLDREPLSFAEQVWKSFR